MNTNCKLHFDGLVVVGITQNGELINGRETGHAVPCDTDTANFIYRFGGEVEIRDGAAYVKRTGATDRLKQQNQWAVPHYLRDTFNIETRSLTDAEKERQEARIRNRRDGRTF